MTLRYTPIVLGREIILQQHDQNRVTIIAMGLQVEPFEKAHDSAMLLCKEYAEKVIPNTPFRFPAVLITADTQDQPIIDGFDVWAHETTEYFTTWIALSPKTKPM